MRFLLPIGAFAFGWLIGLDHGDGTLCAFLPLLAMIGPAVATALPAAAPVAAAGLGGWGTAAAIGGGAVLAGANALGASSYGPGSPGQGPYAMPAGPTGPYVPGAPGPGPYALPGQQAAEAQSGLQRLLSNQWTKRIIKGALGGMSSGDRGDALSAMDRSQQMPGASGGSVPGFAPPQFGVASDIVDRVQKTRGNYPVPGLGS